MEQHFYDMMEISPVIAAIKDEDGLAKCCQLEDLKVVFILYGDICTIEDIVKTVKEAGKIAIVHVDLITGLSAKEIAVDFIRKYTGADGIISTKPGLIRRARELGMYTVMRFFILDSMAVENIQKQLSQVKPDFIEILPGIMPRMIRQVCRSVKPKVIAGGLISDRDEVLAALDAGAFCVSTTNQTVWTL